MCNIVVFWKSGGHRGISHDSNESNTEQFPSLKSFIFPELLKMPLSPVTCSLEYHTRKNKNRNCICLPMHFRYLESCFGHFKGSVNVCVLIQTSRACLTPFSFSSFLIPFHDLHSQKEKFRFSLLLSFRGAFPFSKIIDIV